MTKTKDITLHSVIAEIQTERIAGGYTLDIALNSYIQRMMIVQDAAKDTERKERAYQRGNLAMLYISMLDMGRN